MPSAPQSPVGDDRIKFGQLWVGSAARWGSNFFATSHIMRPIFQVNQTVVVLIAPLEVNGLVKGKSKRLDDGKRAPGAVGPNDQANIAYRADNDSLVDNFKRTSPVP